MIQVQKKREKRVKKLFLLACGFIVLPAWAQQDFSKVEITAEKLSDTVYMLTGAGGNIGLSIGEEAVFMVDDQFAPLTPKIQEAIARLTPKPVKFLVNTHWHFDHTGGNENFGSAGALIVAHENARKRMAAGGAIEFLGMKFNAEPRVALPTITFARDTVFNVNGDELHVMHVPSAHTDGDSIVHFTKSNVIHMGDTFFNKLYPFIDSSSGGSAAGVVANADRVLKMAHDDTKIIPGHGPLATKADLKAFRDMLATVSGRIQKQVKGGKSLAEVIDSKPTAEFDAVWGQGFLNPQRFVEMLYKGMQKK
jgi:glyoxylase-like metal-dependent hydrolase (beta-lactamase superfamily II)